MDRTMLAQLHHQALECMTAWPLMNRNKVQDSKVHIPVEACAAMDNEAVKSLAQAVSCPPALKCNGDIYPQFSFWNTGKPCQYTIVSRKGLSRLAYEHFIRFIYSFYRSGRTKIIPLARPDTSSTISYIQTPESSTEAIEAS